MSSPSLAIDHPIRSSRKIISTSARRLARKMVPFISDAPPRLGGGNYLYMFMHVWRLREDGRPAWIVGQPEMEPWLEMFPALRPLVLMGKPPRVVERRFQWYRSHREFADVLDPFIEAVILRSPGFKKRLARAQAKNDDRTLTINIRRGDYYSVAAFKRRFAVDHDYLFDLVKREVIPVARPDRIQPVSDDLEWCSEVLPRAFPGLPLGFIQRRDLFDDLAHLAVAPHLVLSNSTFSYWGGYLNEHINGAPGLRIWAPTFHERPDSGPSLTGGRFPVISPHWSQLDNAPFEMRRTLA